MGFYSEGKKEGIMIEKQKYLDKWHQERVTNWLPYFDALAKELVKSFKLSLVLDIGCSDGLLLYSFWKLGVGGYGVDISKDSLSYVPEEIRSNVILLDIEKERLPFKDNTFDFITILEVLEHLREHDTILAEMHKVLKPGGLVLISSPLESKTLKIANKLLSLGEVEEESNKPYDYEICNYTPHINVHPKSFWIKEFESEGFRCVEDFKRTHKSLIKRIIAIHEPKEEIAKFLMKFGTLGKKMRVELAYYLWSSALLFKKEV